VHPSVPAKTVAEFIAYAKANPGKISVASAGNGTPPHLAGELFKMMAGVDMLHVPYRGGAPAMTDLIGGRVELLFISELLCIAHIKAGKLRALAVTETTRLDALPDIPMVNESLPKYEASFWAGIAAPQNTPAEVIDKINKEVNAALNDSEMKVRFAEMGGVGLAGSPADFRKLLIEETEKWRAVIKFAGIKVQ
jgi:tripartite-type tricarboxylate transporter receptor subunit TctC